MTPQEFAAIKYVKENPLCVREDAFLAGYSARDKEDGWIKIEEGCEMPGEMEECMFCNTDVRDLFGELAEPSVQTGFYLRNGIFKSWLDARDDFDPTHWQPLPPIPKTD